jgi:hypothetical protein
MVMAQKPYYPDLLDALRETIRQLEQFDPNDSALIELKRTVLLTLAKLDDGKSRPMAAD